MSRVSRVRSLALVFAGVLIAWSALALFGLVAENPFRVATDAAATAGGWSADPVRFDRGSYRFRFVDSVSAAEVIASTEAGEVVAHVELIHVPLEGWSVRRFEASPPRRAAASHHS